MSDIVLFILLFFNTLSLAATWNNLGQSQYKRKKKELTLHQETCVFFMIVAWVIFLAKTLALTGIVPFLVVSPEFYVVSAAFGLLASYIGNRPNVGIVIYACVPLAAAFSILLVTFCPSIPIYYPLGFVYGVSFIWTCICFFVKPKDRKGSQNCV